MLYLAKKAVLYLKHCSFFQRRKGRQRIIWIWHFCWDLLIAPTFSRLGSEVPCRFQYSMISLSSISFSCHPFPKGEGVGLKSKQSIINTRLWIMIMKQTVLKFKKESFKSSENSLQHSSTSIKLIKIKMSAEICSWNFLYTMECSLLDPNIVPFLEWEMTNFYLLLYYLNAGTPQVHTA